jgi:proline iminopeptidase
MTKNNYEIPSNTLAHKEGYIPGKKGRLYYRETGRGLPIIILHGGPDFDQAYLLPEMDYLGRSFRLIYYDQLGRGLSGEGVRPEDINLQSEMENLAALLDYFEIKSAPILGHSFGTLLALEFALRHTQRVSHLILLNPSPASREDMLKFREHRSAAEAHQLEEMKVIATTPEYQSGDLEADADYHRQHFKSTLRSQEDLETLVRRLRSRITPEDILKSRSIEMQLYEETWYKSDYNLLPRLEQLNIPALVLRGEHDFIPREISNHIASALPKARFVELKGCGHFSYLERPEQVTREVEAFLAGI